MSLSTRITTALCAALTPADLEGQVALEAAVLTGAARELAETAVRSAYPGAIETAWSAQGMLGAYVTDHLGSVMDARLYFCGRSIIINVRDGGSTQLTLDAHVAEALAVPA